jgi:hypothetical protein
MGKADQAALAQQMMMYQQTAQNVSPYIQAGQRNLGMLESRLPGLTTNFNPTMEQLAQTPGYQFALQQGLQTAQNSYAGQGLGTSGAAMKGAENYAQGLASTTYQQQFQNYLAQNMQNYNMLSGAANIGLQAAGVQSGLQGSISGSMAGLGQAQGVAQGQGVLGATNALANTGQGLFANLLAGQKLGLFGNTNTTNMGNPYIATTSNPTLTPIPGGP